MDKHKPDGIDTIRKKGRGRLKTRAGEDVNEMKNRKDWA
jgi:hypothetical protein